jgi:glycosyltransferase involved in cell wall biosynthesis
MNELIYNSEKINQNVTRDLIQLSFSEKIEDLKKINFLKIFRFFKIALKLKVRLISFKPDFVYFSIFPTGWGFFRDFLLVVVLKLFRTTPIFHLHLTGIRNKKSWFIKKIYRYTFENSIIIHLSQSLIEQDILPLRLKKSKIFVVPNGIKPEEDLQPVSNKEPFRLLYLSNILNQKDIIYAIQIFYELQKNNDKLEFIIAGPLKSKKLEDTVLNFIKELKLKNVKLRGPLYGNQKYQEYLNADIFFYPTSYDSFPLVLLEAMSVGLPIVTTTTGAIPEFLTHNKTAMLADYIDQDDIIEKTSLLIKHKNIRTNLGRMAKIEFTNKYTHKHFEENMCEVFLNLRTKN